MAVLLSNKSAATAAALLGAAIAILEAVSVSFRFRENWLTSIAARDNLLLEWRIYAGKAGPYVGKTDQEATALLVARAVRHVRTESNTWQVNQVPTGEPQHQPVGDATAVTAIPQKAAK